MIGDRIDIISADSRVPRDGLERGVPRRTGNVQRRASGRSQANSRRQSRGNARERHAPASMRRLARSIRLSSSRWPEPERSCARFVRHRSHWHGHRSHMFMWSEASAAGESEGAPPQSLPLLKESTAKCGAVELPCWSQRLHSYDVL